MSHRPFSAIIGVNASSKVSDKKKDHIIVAVENDAASSILLQECNLYLLTYYGTSRSFVL